MSGSLQGLRSKLVNFIYDQMQGRSHAEHEELEHKIRHELMLLRRKHERQIEDDRMGTDLLHQESHLAALVMSDRQISIFTPQRQDRKGRR